MSIEVVDLPADRLRRLLDAFAIQIHYDRPNHRATFMAHISADALPNVTAVTGQLPGPRHYPPREHRNHRSVGPSDCGADPAPQRGSSLTCPAGGTF